MPTFTSADRVGAIGGYIGGISALLGGLGNNGGCNNGLLGGLFGNNNGNCYVSEKEFMLAQRLNASEANNARLMSENFTREAATKAFADSVTFADTQVQRTNAIVEKLSNAVIALQSEAAVLRSDIRCLSVTNDKDHEAIIAGYKSADALEAERRACGDHNLQAWTQGELNKKVNYSQYIDGSAVFCPDSSICGGRGSSSK